MELTYVGECKSPFCMSTRRGFPENPNFDLSLLLPDRLLRTRSHETFLFDLLCSSRTTFLQDLGKFRVFWFLTFHINAFVVLQIDYTLLSFR